MYDIQMGMMDRLAVVWTDSATDEWTGMMDGLAMVWTDCATDIQVD